MNQQQRAVVRRALDALTYIHAKTSQDEDEIINAITALRQLLEQPEPVQEPVAWMNPHGGFLSATYIEKFASGLDKETHNIPLYATPPAQSAAWVGLTGDEVWDVYKQVDSMQYMEFSRAIEAKLREKNAP
jgi:hypothetical protein